MTIDRLPPFDVSLVEVGDELLEILAASGTGIWRWDAASGEVRWDTTLEALSGLAPGSFGGTYEAWHDSLHPEEVEWILARVSDAIEARSSYHFEHRTIWPDGSVHWLECRGQVTTDEFNAFTGTVGCAVDVTARREADHRRAEALERERRLRDRLEFLVRLTAPASDVADHLGFMHSAAAAAVPKLGDWCSIHYIPEDGLDIEIAIAHADPTKMAWASELTGRFPYDPNGEIGVPAVIRSGRTQFIELVTDEIIEERLAHSTIDAAAIGEILQQLGLTSVITVPLKAKRGVRGAMQFVSAESGRVYDEDDVALAEAAASRIADALDNLWLTEQHQRIAASLQRALLPPKMPPIPGVDIAVRYWPAGIAVEAGGDFYDVFRTADDAWSVVIGDVCGTGPDAAAVTSIARHTVRAAARHGLDHRDVHHWLNDALLLSDRDRFCTAVYATLSLEGDRWRFASCAAGHPLPIVIRADGSAEAFGESGTLLGVFDELKLPVGETHLAVGDVVVLYTDGLTDRPPPYGRTESDMVELFGRIARDTPAEDIADAIHQSLLERLPANQRADDVALVVLRVEG